MKIIRTASKDFVQIANSAVRDYRLSWRARGLLAELLSYPPGWETTVDRLVANARKQGKESEGRGAMRTAMAELAKLGYVRYVRQPGKGGLWSTEIWVSDAPIGPPTDVPETGSSVTGTSVTGSSVTETSDTGPVVERRSTKTERNKDHKDSSSSSRPPTLAYVCDLLNIDDDDGKWLINEIKTQNRPTKLGAYIRSMDAGDFRELLDERKAAQVEADALDDGLEPKHVPWCGECGPKRLNDVLNDRGLVTAASWCEKCSPNRKRKPRAGAKPKPPGHQPYRNPTDPDYYKDWNADRSDAERSDADYRAPL